MSSDPPKLDPDATRMAPLDVADSGDVTKGERDMAYLIVLNGSNVGEMFRVEGDELVIGRAADAAIRLQDEGISRNHARLIQQGGEVAIEDLQSANGTVVNGTPVKRQALHDGDKIRLGSTTILKFTYHDKLDESFQQQMYDAALRDGLTRTYNKKYFLDRLDTEFAFSRRHQSHLSLLMFDVDHFKRVNDNHGHLAGDAVLVHLTRVVQATLRTEDVLARYGGEEFAVICRSVKLADAAVMGERLRRAVEHGGFLHGDEPLPVTISVGVAAHPELPLRSAAELIHAADEALYDAKHGGRNRVALGRGRADPPA